MLETIIFILSFLVRLYNLDLFPIYYDEATWTWGSIANFDRFFGIPVVCFQGYIQPSFSCMVIVLKKIFLNPVYAIRIPSVIIGTATVILVYVLAKQMYGKRTGLITASLLAFLPWHVLQSKVGVSLILTPFFGCLIFYSLFRSLQKQSNYWFILSWFFLGIGSFYTYQVSLIFIPIFLIILLLLNKNIYWLKLRIIFSGVLVFLISVWPLIYLQIHGKIPLYLYKISERYYDRDIVKSEIIGFLLQLAINFKTNLITSFKGIFISNPFCLFLPVFHYPLLISCISLLIVIFSVGSSIYFKEAQDKILLIWLGVGYLSCISFAGSNAERYYFTIILAPLLILIGKCINQIFVWAHAQRSIRKILLFSIGAAVFLFLTISEAKQLIGYYNNPRELIEFQFSSYGCREAAQYLSRIPRIKDYEINQDKLMEPLELYLDYYISKEKTSSGILETKEAKFSKYSYYCVWTPDSRPKDYEFFSSELYEFFKKRYPEAKPVKTIFYPNGIPAIEIFLVERSGK